MEFLRRCQEWMVVNLTKPIQGAGQEEELKVAKSHDSTQRLLRGESRDTLVSFENSDEDAKLLRSKSIENLEAISERMSSTDKSEDIGREALANPGMILWHPPSTEFKITMPIKRGHFPVKYRVKKCPDSQEYYFLVEGLDEKSSFAKKLSVGDWLQSVKGDESAMVALSNGSAKEKLEELVKTSNTLTIIFQRPKSIWRQQKERKSSAQNGEIVFSELDPNSSSTPRVLYYDSISCCEDSRSEDIVTHSDIDFSMGSRSDRSSVNNMWREEVSESSEAFQSSQLTGQAKPRGFYKNTKVHPVSPPVEDCGISPQFPIDNQASVQIVSNAEKDKGTMSKNGVLAVLPRSKVRCVMRYRKGHRRVHSDGSVRSMNLSPAKLSPLRRFSDSCSALPMFPDSTNEWAAFGELKKQMTCLKTYVVTKIMDCCCHLDEEYLPKVPVINIPVISNGSCDMRIAEQILSDIFGMDKEGSKSNSTDTFCISTNEIVQFSKTISKLKKIKLPDSVYEELSRCEVDQLVMAKHCASTLRAYASILNNLETVSRFLLQDDSKVNGIPLNLIGYFLCNPPVPHGFFVKVELKSIAQDELLYSGVEFTEHSISCIFISLAGILNSPADYLISLSNKINFIQSYAGNNASILLLAQKDASDDDVGKAGYYLQELLKDKFQQGLVWNRVTGLPLFCVDLHEQHVQNSKADMKKCPWNDFKALKAVLQNMVTKQDFLQKKPMSRYPITAMVMSMNIQSLIKNSGIVTSSLTQFKELAMDLFGKAHSKTLVDTLKALHQSRKIVYHDEVVTKTVHNPILDMFVLLQPDWIQECAKQLTKDHQNKYTHDQLVAKIPCHHLKNGLEDCYLDSHERLAFLEVFHIISPVKHDKRTSFYTLPLSIPSSNEPNGTRSLYKSDRTLMMDFHGYLPLPLCLHLLCLICEQFEGDTSFLSPLLAVFSGRVFEFQLELCPWKAFGIISVRLQGKKPYVFIEFFHNLMLSLSRKHALLGLDYSIGVLCPLVHSGQCKMVSSVPESLHIIALDEPTHSLHCGNTDLMAYPSVVEWFRGLLRVHPYESRKIVSADNSGDVEGPLCTIELGTSLLHLPSELFSLLCQELLVRNRWKTLAGNMGMTQHDVDMLTIHENPPSQLFHQWSYSTNICHQPSTLGNLFHYFAVGIQDQFGDVKTRIKDWIEDNGYVLMSSTSNNCSSKLPENSLNVI